MFKKVFTSKKFYLSILGIIAFGCIMLAIFNYILMPNYTNYNEGVTVPDVTKISLEEAQERLESFGLRVEITDRRANSAFPANYVIDQFPSALMIVKPNRKVYLTVNTEVRPQVIVPSVVNLSLRNAQIQLENYGLTLGSISYESSRFKNTVLRQSVEAGITVPKGISIDLAVSDGLGDKIVTIPEIVGLSLPQAQQKLREAGLRIGEITFRPIKDIIPNTVLAFSPNVQQINEGSTLNLIISERFEVTEVIEGVINVDSTNNQNPPNNFEDK